MPWSMRRTHIIHTYVPVHTPVRVMSICFHKISNIQNNFKFEQSLHSLGPHHLCFFACTIKRWNQQKSFQRLKMGKKSRRHPENGEGHIGKQEGRDRPLPRIHILRKNREATCSEIRTSGTVISGSVSWIRCAWWYKGFDQNILTWAMCIVVLLICTVSFVRPGPKDMTKVLHTS